MKAPRLALLCRHYWPQSRAEELVAADLARGLGDLGVSVEVVTAAWEKHWPREVWHREIPVTRLAHPERGGWGGSRFLKQVGEWLRRRGPALDAVCVWAPDPEADLAADVCRQLGKPLLLRCDAFPRLAANARGGAAGAAAARRALTAPRWRLCDAIVSSSAETLRALAEQGACRERLHCVPVGVPDGPPRSSERRQAARSALALAHPIFQLAPEAPLAVCFDELDDAFPRRLLLDAWSLLEARFPQARLWIVGEGTAGPDLYREVRQRDWQERVILPGLFDDWDDLLAAADVLVAPRAAASGRPIAAALAAGLPALLADVVDHQRFLAANLGLAAPGPLPREWAEALAQLFETPGESSAAAARQDWARTHASSRRMAESHLELLRRLGADAFSPRR